MQPLVSVILPVRNGGHFLAAAVESILGQSFESLELILVDDHSSDNTAQEAVEDDIRVGFNAFGDSAMNIAFTYFIKKDGAILGTQSTVNLGILERFSREGLEFAFPTQTIYTIGQSA